MYSEQVSPIFQNQLKILDGSIKKNISELITETDIEKIGVDNIPYEDAAFLNMDQVEPE